MNKFKLGIDIGSTTVKIAVLDDNNNILFSDYERHFANIQVLLHRHNDLLGDLSKGSAALGVSRALGFLNIVPLGMS